MPTYTLPFLDGFETSFTLDSVENGRCGADALAKGGEGADVSALARGGADVHTIKSLDEPRTLRTTRVHLCGLRMCFPTR